MGRSLVDAVLADEPGARFWAHGGLAPARALGADRGLEVVRELHRMARPVRAQDREPVGLPEGLVARSFVVGQDEQAWLELNATAFADHPDIVIPAVVAVGDEVLVTEWMDSPHSLAHVIRDGTQEERDHIARSAPGYVARADRHRGAREVER